MDASGVSVRARELAGAIEPVAGQVYFSPECHAAYAELGFSPGPSAGAPVGTGVVAMPDGAAYFCSRGSVLGEVPGEVVAAAFGVFNPAVVVPLVARGKGLTSAAALCEARTAGAVGQLVRILGAQPPGLARATELLAAANEGLQPAGRPLYAGLLSLGLPGDPMGDMWRLADRLREYRGDCHISAWTATGFDAVEIGLLTELFWGLPMRTYIRTRAWNDDQLDAAEARLVARGLVADGGFTPEGAEVREEIERRTDEQCRPIVENLGDAFDELITILRPWADAIRTAGGYPAAGPHDLARVVRR